MEEWIYSMGWKTKMYGCLLSLMVIISTVIICCSFGAVEPTEYGILYNHITKSINTNLVYDGGLVWTGLFHSLKIYPSI